MTRKEIFSKIFLLAAGGIVGILLSVYFVPLLANRTALEQYKTDGYSVVYFSNGELYVGKLSVKPEMKLLEPYMLQVVKDTRNPARNNFQLIPLKDTVWSTKTLYVNKDQVLYYSPLDSDSQVAQQISKQNAAAAEKKKAQ